MPQILSREEAKALGLKRYFTGKPCKHGHLAQRKVSNTECVVCAAAVCRNHYANNKEYHFRKTARYREENRERYNEYNRSYHAALTPEQKNGGSCSPLKLVLRNEGRTTKRTSTSISLERLHVAPCLGGKSFCSRKQRLIV